MKKPHNDDWQGMLVYSDFLKESGDDKYGEMYEFLGHLQGSIHQLWSKYRGAFTPSELRYKRCSLRERIMPFTANDKAYVVMLRFCPETTQVYLYKQWDHGYKRFPLQYPGLKFICCGATHFYNETAHIHAATKRLAEATKRFAEMENR